MRSESKYNVNKSTHWAREWDTEFEISYITVWPGK